jgi:uncharacterized protein (DUF885 family)
MKRQRALHHFIGLSGFLLFFIIVLGSCRAKQSIGQISNDYIETWRQFYPSHALAAGDSQAAFRFENLAPVRIKEWLQYNRSVLAKLDRPGEFSELSLDDRIDARLLKRQVFLELEKWQQDRQHRQSPALYSEMISQAVTHLLARDQLKPAETRRAIENRLKGMNELCREGIRSLENGPPERTQGSIDLLEKTAAFYQQKLSEIGKIQGWLKRDRARDFQEKTAETAGMILKLKDHIKANVLPHMTLPDAMGKEHYSRILKRYTDSSLSPGELENLAFKEIETVRQMMAAKAGEYWQVQYPGKEMPGDVNLLLKQVMADMESHREKDQQGFLKQFKDLIDRSEAFVRQNRIATLSGKRTLFTALSPPHFAGAAVGGVYPSGPFNPEADTLFYLPTVPDSAPQEVKDGFYRSFNNHFNAMIITHEIVPGHYWQLKRAAFHPRRVRSLFAGDVFTEGWATLCEQITLEKGWGGGDLLTYLAHLRKRLENAVRAYTSVKVHCNGWKKEQLIRFAVNKGLLAPQFAANLWDRVMNSPLQLNSYFLGYRAFHRLLENERKRLGKDFKLRDFCDTILEAGAAPIDLLPLLFSSS